MSVIIRIEQRLQEHPRFFLLSADEAIVIIFPFVFGLLAKKLFIGAVVAFVLWQVWKRIKGEGGLEGISAALYWFLPSELRLSKSLPDAGVTIAARNLHIDRAIGIFHKIVVKNDIFICGRNPIRAGTPNHITTKTEKCCDNTKFWNFDCGNTNYNRARAGHDGY